MGLDYYAAAGGPGAGRPGVRVAAEDGTYVVMPPFQRPDLTIPADLVEEVARLVGYEGIPATLLRGAPPAWQGNPARDCRGRGARRAGRRRLLGGHQLPADQPGSAGPAGAGRRGRPRDPLAREIAARLLDVTTPPVQLANPLTPEMAVMRTSAVPALLDHLSRGLRQQDRDVALYEFARVYIPRHGDLPDERRVLTVGCGQYVSGQKWGSKEEADFFALKAVAQELSGPAGRGRRQLPGRPPGQPSIPAAPP